MIETTKYGLPDSDVESVISILKKHSKIEKAILFGSRAKGNYSNGSDVDIALVGKDLKSTDIFTISEKIEQLYLPWKFDIVIYDRIKEKTLIEHIDRVGIPLLG
ncbi:MAG TPA: nucleotidyltransferase domain-containing protein [Sunxiuqinia sp.]|nr:nucleotidyltransferase domain-containing protein [Sunxiuqinia sp.]